MADQELLSIVWGETSGLAAKDRADETLGRLHAVVAKLAAVAKRRGLNRDLKRQLAPRVGDKELEPAYNAMLSTVNAVDSGTYRPPIELPSRAVLWEINENGVPPRDNVPPKSIAWMFDPDVTSGGDFVAGAGANIRTYRLFESAKLPTEDELPYVSGYTGSGVPVPSVERRWYRSPNWAIGLSGGALFFLAVFSLLWTASSFSQAYDLLNNRQIRQSKALVSRDCPADATAEQKRYCAGVDESLTGKKDDELKVTRALRDQQIDRRLAALVAAGPACSERLSRWGGDEKAARTAKGTAPDRSETDQDSSCLSLLGDAVTYAAKNLVIKGDTKIGYLVQWVAWWLFGWQVPTSATQTVSLGMPTALMMLGVVLVLIGLGRGVNGTPLGALISPNGRYSLALAQVTFWTILVLTSVVAIATFNGGLISEMARYSPPPNGFFPDVPAGIWGVLGISFGSTIVSALIKSLKGTDSPDPTMQVSDESSRPVGGLSMFKAQVTGYDPLHRASIADWFLGEDTDNKDKIDISRVQMVLITAGLLITYGNAIFSAIADLTPQEILFAIKNVNVLIPSLPIVGTSMTVMLAVSHATYLVSKAADTPGRKTSEVL